MGVLGDGFNDAHCASDAKDVESDAMRPHGWKKDTEREFGAAYFRVADSRELNGQTLPIYARMYYDCVTAEGPTMKVTGENSGF